MDHSVSTRRRIREDLRRRLAPSVHGLPSALTLWWFPALVMVVFALLVAFEINGSSNGLTWTWFNSTADPDQLTGQPRPVRSDEWFAQLSWTISQYHQGFPPVNPGSPGGTDLTTLWDVPVQYWTGIFRPQLWGYFFLGLSHGLAWQWWLPAALAMIAVYLLVVTLNPRRPLTAAVLAVTAIVSPMLLWWWQTTGFLSVGWPLFTMAAMVWILKDPRFLVRTGWMAAAGFFAVNLALTSYVPFILTGVWIAVLFGVGVMIDTIRDREMPARKVVARMGGLVLAGAVAGAVVGTYALLRRDTFRAIAGTVYPGQRSDPTGLLAGDSDAFLALFGAPFNGALRSVQGETGLGSNQSESAATFMVATFLVPGLVLLIIAARRATGRWSWSAVSVVAAVTLYVAYLYVANWDLGARLFLLDKVPTGRARLAFAGLLPAAAAVTIRLVDHLPAAPRRLAAVLAGAVAVAINVAVWRGLRGGTPNILAEDSSWRIAVVAVCLGTIALFFRRLVLPGAVALLVATTVVSVGIVPLHRGVVDLHDSVPGRAIEAIDSREPGTWVGTVFPVTTALLEQSGVKSFSAVQSYPTDSLWSDLDPTSSREQTWNRYAHLDWHLAKTGQTRERLGGADYIVIEMDPCSDFAQRRVDYVLTPVVDNASSPCLTPVRTIDTPAIDLEVLRVVPPSKDRS